MRLPISVQLRKTTVKHKVILHHHMCEGRWQSCINHGMKDANKTIVIQHSCQIYHGKRYHKIMFHDSKPLPIIGLLQVGENLKLYAILLKQHPNFPTSYFLQHFYFKCVLSESTVYVYQGMFGVIHVLTMQHQVTSHIQMKH